VETVTAAGLTAVVDHDDHGGARASADLMVSHAGMVTSLLTTCDAVLPVRGGSRVADDDEVRHLLRSRVEELRRGLDEVRGAVELAVACEPDRSPASAAKVMDGRDYLGDRVEAWRRADEMVDRVRRLGTLCAVRQVRLLAHSPAGIKASLLVGAQQWAAVRDDVLAALADPGSTVRCTGPFAAYSFSVQEPDRPMATL
jgi:hypothetical protein